MLLVPFFDNMPEAMQRARFTADGILEVRTGEALAVPCAVASCTVPYHTGPNIAVLT